jgi:hypothetical protein
MGWWGAILGVRNWGLGEMRLPECREPLTERYLKLRRATVPSSGFRHIIKQRIVGLPCCLAVGI